MRISDWSSDVCSSDLVEGDGKPLLPRRQVAAIEGVGFLGGRKARILPDGPGTPRIHGSAHAPRERRETGKARIANFIWGHVLRRIERLDGDPFRGFPVQILALHLDRKSTRLNSSH